VRVWGEGGDTEGTGSLPMRRAVEKRPSAAFPSPFVVAAYKKIRLTSQDSGVLHMSIFEQP
jgi:hypothetical protein